MRNGNRRNSARRNLLQSTRTAIEALECRTLLSFTAAFTAADRSNFTGNSSGGSGDILIFAQSGGLLMHNRFAAGDAGFASAFDFDSAVAGDQTLAASPASTVDVRPGDSSLDEVRIGGTVGPVTAAASELLATFIVFNFDTVGQKVQVNDASSATPNTYTVSDDAVTGTGINVSYNSFVGTYGSIEVLGGSGADTFEVTSSTRDPYTLHGGDPASIPGDVLNFDTQFVDGTDSGTQITQAGRQPVNYQNIETVNVLNEIADPAQLVVRNTNNSGPNSLRNAITLANFLPGPNTITFDIPGGGVQTIAPTELPFITDTVTIDGYSQPGSSPNTLASGANNAVINVRLDGSNAGGPAGAGSGLRLVRGAEGSVIRGLQFTQYAGEFQSAITVQPISGTGFYVDDVVIAGNFIGTDGVDDLGNGIGIRFEAIGTSRIGGTTPADRNVISGNAINIDLQAQGVAVAGNLIGLNAAGTATLQDQGTGILVRSGRAFESTIGGPTAAHRNVIAGHSDYGIEIGNGAGDNRILGNYIGTDVTGNAALSGSIGIGVNWPARTEIGGPAVGEGNVITGTSRGILLEAGESIIRGNRIGTNAAGTAALVNGNVGIEQIDGKSVIGGPNAGDRNIISGWNANGISFVSTVGSPDATADVYGNYIGTDVTGTIDLGNNLGVLVGSNLQAKIGGAAPGQGNLISGNTVFGVSLGRFAFGVQVYGNRIGTDVTGTLPLGNDSDGVFVTGSNNFVGGTGSGQGNIIAFNGGNGVNVRPSGGSSATSNAILGNSIFSNTLLGIDLNSDGVTPNDPGDADNGPNGLTNKPTVNTAFTNVTGVGVNATLQAQPSSTYTVQFFASPGADPSGEGEGKRLLGTAQVNTDISGAVTFDAEFPVAIPAGQVVTATATGADGTSEFSNAATVTGNPPRVSIGDVTVTEGNGVPVAATFTVTLSDAVSVPVIVDFLTADGTAVAPADYLAQSGSVTFNPGETSRTITVTVNPDSAAEGTETFVVNLTNTSVAGIADGQGVGTILNHVVSPPPPPPPASGFSINDRSISEGNSGTKQFVFTVTRGGNISAAASVKFKTVNQTAGAADYNLTSGTLNFAPGQASKTISVTVKGDTSVEANETFRVELHTAVGATIADNKGIGTIVNDDTALPNITPKVFIGDASIFEGDSGTRTLTFTVTLDKATSKTVSVNYATQDGTATQLDYIAKSGTITFAAGQTSKTIQILIKGDTKVGVDEQFKVNLSGLVNATLGDGQGIGTIKNDD